ncbi:AraC family transcriptional regulator [Promicromonospora sukumoe]|uniref:AraC family transcriptional regulator n=1 Tax=Promicromonospora sukumoe TaxID=88382 RepID=UPI00364CA709
MLASSDPLGDAIGLLRPRTTIGPSVRAAGVWAARFESFPHMKVGLVVRGACWLIIEGREPVRLEEGDFYLLGNPPPYVLASTATADPRAATRVQESAVDGVASLGPDVDDFTYVCDGRYAFDDANAHLLTDALPSIVVVRATDQHARRLKLVSELLLTEYEAAAVGRSLVLNHLGQILLVQMVRAHVTGCGHPSGWLGALNDDGVGAALRAMHADMTHTWTVQELAGISHMSRSAFARSFKSQVGVPPLEYLIRWRMSLARDALRRDVLSITQLASATGYGSESAFSTAFSRVVGSSPAKFRDKARSSISGGSRHQERPRDPLLRG